MYLYLDFLYNIMKKEMWVAVWTLISIIIGALTAYIIAAGQVLSAIFNFGNYFYFSLGFLIVLSAIIFFNLNIFQRAESILNPLKLIIITLLIIFLFPYVNFSNLLEFNFKNLLIPYGVIIFAFTGFSAIPEMAYELKNKINLRKAIIYAMLITFVIYSLFCLVMIGISGKDITQVATLSLENLGNFSLFGNLFSLLALSTAFIGLGFSLKNSLILDYKLKNLFSWIFVIGIPAILFFLNLGNFILFLELSGAISIGVILISILIMHSKAKSIGKRKPEFQFKDNLFVKVLLFILVIIGIIYTLSG